MHGRANPLMDRKVGGPSQYLSVYISVCLLFMLVKLAEVVKLEKLVWLVKLADLVKLIVKLLKLV